MKKLSIIKIALVIVVLLAAIIITLPDKYDSKGNIEKAFPSIIEDFQKINKISFEIKSIKYFLKKQSNKWVLEGYNNYPVDIKKINNFILKLYDSSFLDIKETSSINYNKLGVGYPLSKEEAIRIKFLNNNNIINDFIIGKNYKKNDKYNVNYYRNSQEQLVLLLKNELTMPKDELFWIDSNLFKIGRWRIKEVSINDIKQKNFIKIGRDNYGSQNFKLYNLPSGYELIKNYSPNSIAAIFEGIKIENIIPNDLSSDKNLIKINKKIKLSTFDGLILNLDLITINGDNFFKIMVTSDKSIRQELHESGEKIIGIPKMKSFEEVEKQENKMKFSEKWLYKFDQISLDALSKTKSDLIKKIPD